MLAAIKWNTGEEFLKHIELSEKIRQLSGDQYRLKATLLQTLPDYIVLDASDAEHAARTISELEVISAQQSAPVTCP